MQSIIQLGINVLVTDADTVVIKNPFAGFVPAGPACNFEFQADKKVLAFTLAFVPLWEAGKLETPVLSVHVIGVRAYTYLLGLAGCASAS